MFRDERSIIFFDLPRYATLNSRYTIFKTFAFWNNALKDFPLLPVSS